MTVRDGENPDVWITDNIRNVVREYLQIDSAITSRALTWQFVVPLNPYDVTIDFFPESQSQSAELAFIVSDRILKL